MITETTIDISHTIRKQLSVSKFEIRKSEDYILNRFIYDLVACFAGTHQDPWIFKQPSSWWQHFKKQVFPAWLKKRFPVKEKETKLDVTLLYPHLKTSLPLEVMGRSVTIRVCNSVGLSKFLNADPESPMEPMMQINQAMDHKLYDPSSRRCPVCRKTLEYQ